MNPTRFALSPSRSWSLQTICTTRGKTPDTLILAFRIQVLVSECSGDSTALVCDVKAPRFTDCLATIGYALVIDLYTVDSAS